MMLTPMTAFIRWFESIPKIHGQYLAHVFRLCITEDTADMVMTQEQSLERFKHYFVRTDFPLRIAAKMVMVRGVIDFIMVNRQELILDNPNLFPFDFSQQPKIELLAEHQWDKTFDSWKGLRRAELSDSYLYSWSRAVIAPLNSDSQ